MITNIPDKINQVIHPLFLEIKPSSKDIQDTERTVSDTLSNIITKL